MMPWLKHDWSYSSNVKFHQRLLDFHSFCFCEFFRTCSSFVWRRARVTLRSTDGVSVYILYQLDFLVGQSEESVDCVPSIDLQAVP